MFNPELFSMPLPDGFRLRDRFDLGAGSILPHVDTDILRPDGSTIRRPYGGPDLRDMSHHPVPGFNNVKPM
jgi:hypothetical protein